MIEPGDDARDRRVGTYVDLDVCDSQFRTSRVLKNSSFVSFRGAEGDEESRISRIFRARFLGMTQPEGAFQHSAGGAWQTDKVAAVLIPTSQAVLWPRLL